MMMDMHFSENLKNLRKAKNLTQEELAGYLGVSGQAVSKWETGAGMPDLPLLITTAAYFGVSLDELVGMDDIRNTARYLDMTKQADVLSRTNRPAEAVAVYRKILALYPEDWQIMMRTAACLCAIGGEAKEANAAEAVRLYQRVAERCPDRRLASHADIQICLTLSAVGRNKEAIRHAVGLQLDPHNHYALMMRLTEADNRFVWCRELALESTSCIAQAIDEATQGTHFSREEKIRLLQKIPALFDLLWDNGDYAEFYLTVAGAWWRITHLSLKDGEVDEAFHALGECARFVALYDRAEDVHCTSLLFEGHHFIQAGALPEHGTHSGDHARAIRQMPEFDAIRDDERMAPILTLLDDVHAEVKARHEEAEPAETFSSDEPRPEPPDRETLLAVYHRAFDAMTAAMRGGSYDRESGWKEAERAAEAFFVFGHPSDEEIRSVLLDFASCGEIAPSPFGSATSTILSAIADSERDRFPRAFEILSQLEKTAIPQAFIQKKTPHP
ncbi:MAG: helix-turn-helix transcriptional regulator [Clostridia bacterium]|nr:helix-turn-helix transcriptional regulator [Clostridia bacterium]